MTDPSDAAATPDPHWMVMDLKVQILVFYKDNPGTIETIEGLAARLGVDAGQLHKEMREQIDAGVVKERKSGEDTFLVVDRKRTAEIHAALEKAMANKTRSIVRPGAT